MKSNGSSSLHSINKHNTSSYFYLLLALPILLSFFIISDISARSLSDKYYLQIERSKTSEKTDLDITSIGVLALQKNMVGYVELNQINSDINGDGLTLDFGGGYAFNWNISPYLALGVSLGRNKDNSDNLASYYPEVGIVADITKTFGITASAKRYHHLYDENENIIMLGLVFRD